MHLAAMLDLGQHLDIDLNLEWLKQGLSRLNLNDQFTLDVRPGEKMGISGTQIKVLAKDQAHHRRHSTIVDMIRTANYSATVTQRTLAMFKTIAYAEAKIHNIPVEAVHFHEVGAIDALVDIVGAALCMDKCVHELGVEFVLCQAIEVGSGFVDCAHGRFPVPAPATQEILAGAPCTYGGVTGESTTPTGASILASNVTEFMPQGAFSPTFVGYGIGHKDFARPNVLRLVYGQYAGTPEHSADHMKIEANIDDMTAEAFEPLMQALFKAGAVEVYYTPIIMKKGRPAQCVTALCHAERVEAVSHCLLNESTTIGLRQIPFQKVMLPRRLETIETDLGAVRVKVVIQPNGQKRWKVEHKDVQQAAELAGLDYQSTYHRLEQQVAVHFLANDNNST